MPLRGPADSSPANGSLDFCNCSTAVIMAHWRSQQQGWGKIASCLNFKGANKERCSLLTQICRMILNISRWFSNRIVGMIPRPWRGCLIISSAVQIWSSFSGSKINRKCRWLPSVENMCYGKINWWRERNGGNIHRRHRQSKVKIQYDGNAEEIRRTRGKTGKSQDWRNGVHCAATIQVNVVLAPKRDFRPRTLHFEDPVESQST